jgi:hydroxymethylglutaryl-CoA lyase
VLLAEQSGFDTGVDLGALLDAIGYAESILGRDLGGRAGPWLRRKYRPRQT